jgi:hypothetical protein
MPFHRGPEMARAIVAQGPGADDPDQPVVNPSSPGGLLRDSGAGFTTNSNESGPLAIFDASSASRPALDIAWSTDNFISPGSIDGAGLQVGNQPPSLPAGPSDGAGPMTAPDMGPTLRVGGLEVAGAPANGMVIRLAGGPSSVFGLAAGVTPPVATANALRVIAMAFVNAVAAGYDNSRTPRAGSEISTRAMAEVLANAVVPAEGGAAVAFAPSPTAAAMGASAMPMIDKLVVRSSADETAMPLLAGLLQPAVALGKFKSTFAMPQPLSPAEESSWIGWVNRLLRSPFLPGAVVAIGGLEVLRRYIRRSAGKDGGPIDVPEVTGPVGL